MRMKSMHEAEWHDVCGNCAFFDGTQTHTHCCEIHIHSKLKHGSCNNFLYDKDHYGKDYGVDVLTEDQIKAMTVGYPDETTVSLAGKQLSYSDADFSMTLGKDGSISLWAGALGIRLADGTVNVLRRLIEEATARKGGVKE